MKPCNAATYRKATYQLALAENPRILVEVGVYAGALSQMFAQLPSIERQVIVDSWEGNYCDFGQPHMDLIAAKVQSWAADYPKIEVLRMRSNLAAALFADESVDFFHTDGDHSLEGISADITFWLPKVRAGGILSGDNYEIAAVAQGVDALLPNRQLLANGRLWWSRK